MFTYDETNKILTVGDKQFSGLSKSDVENITKAAHNNDKLIAQFAGAIGKLVKAEAREQASAAITAKQSEIERAVMAQGLPGKYLDALKKFNADSAEFRAKYALENVKPVGGVNEDGTFKFTSKTVAKLDGLAVVCEGVRVGFDGEQWVGSFDNPDLYAKSKGARDAELTMQGIANKVNGDNGPIKDLRVSFDDQGKLTWKSSGSGTGAGGSTAGRDVANGYKVVATGTTYRTAAEVISALDLKVNGAKYPQKEPAFLKAVEDGRVVKCYKTLA